MSDAIVPLLRRVLLALPLLAGCPKAPSEQAVPMPVGETARWTEADGPIAGPHNIVEGPPDAPIAPDTPGAGSWPLYVTAIRKAANQNHLPCVEHLGVSATTAAMVVLTIQPSGEVTEVVLTRSSGVEQFDQCLVRAFRGLKIPPPPAELLVDGQLVSKEIAFR